MTCTKGSRIRHDRNPGEASSPVWDLGLEEDESGSDF
jgi:hypothetical protein